MIDKYKQISFFEDEIVVNSRREQKEASAYSEDMFNNFQEIDFSFSMLSLYLPPIYNSLSKLVPKENVVFLNIDIEKAIVCEMICAALCHQINWDFLREVVYKKTYSQPEWINADYLSKIQIDEVANLLGSYSKPERIRASERTEILRTLGNCFSHFPNGLYGIFFTEVGKPQQYSYIRDQLLSCSVFSNDPVEKKLQLLFLKISNYQGFKFMDDYYKPTIDYHLIRSFLRRGYLLAKTKYAIDFISTDSNRQEHTVAAVRKHCASIIDKLCELTSLGISSINDIEWWIGRSVCIESNPECELNSSETEWLKPHFSKCPFYEYCLAIQTEEKFLLLAGPNYKGTSY